MVGLGGTSKEGVSVVDSEEAEGKEEEESREDEEVAIKLQVLPALTYPSEHSV